MRRLLSILFAGLLVFNFIQFVFATPVELITNGVDWTGASGQTPPNSWTKDSNYGSNEIDSGKIKLIAGTSANNWSISQAIATVIGKTYILSCDIQNNNLAAVEVHAGSVDWYYYDLARFYESGTAHRSASFVATTTMTYIACSTSANTEGEYGWVDNVSLVEASSDQLIMVN